MKTYIPKPEEIEKKWYLIDAQDKVLGRLATRIATILRGKNKPFFTPATDCGDFIVVVNVGKIKLTGKKLEQKIYWRHSGYPDGKKTLTAEEMFEKKPELLLQLAVKRMLPKNKLRAKLLKKLKIYSGNEHPHLAQEPMQLKM